MNFCRVYNYEAEEIRIFEMEEGKITMKIAVTYDNGQVFQHFGHTKQFKVYEVTDGKVQTVIILNTYGSGHGALAGFLKQNGIDALICGGIGMGAKQALAEADIRLYGGVVGDSDQAIANLLANKLTFNPDEECLHHNHDNNCHCGENAMNTHIKGRFKTPLN